MERFTREQITRELQAWTDDIEAQIQFVSLLYESGLALEAHDYSAIQFETFFTKLYGLVSELRTFIKYHFPTPEELKTLMIDSPELNLSEEQIAICAAAHHLCEVLEKALSSDELLAIEFLRNKACHLVTSKYLFSFSKNGHPVARYEGQLKSELRAKILQTIANLGGANEFGPGIFLRIKREIYQLRGLLIWQSQLLGVTLISTLGAANSTYDDS